MSETYSVYNTIEVLDSGLTFEQAFAELMRRAYCTWRWEYEAGETRIAVRYEGSLPEAYDSVRNLKSPYFRSPSPTWRSPAPSCAASSAPACSGFSSPRTVPKPLTGRLAVGTDAAPADPEG